MSEQDTTTAEREREADRDEGRDEGRLSTADLAASRDTDDTEARRDVDPGDDDGGRTALFEGEESERFRLRWQEIQTGFVDEPQGAVKNADGLVAELMQRLAETFSEERARLESQWGGEGDVSTEELRVALQRYRSFFDRLLSA